MKTKEPKKDTPKGKFCVSIAAFIRAKQFYELHGYILFELNDCSTIEFSPS